MEKKPEVLYGYKVLEDGDQVAVWVENKIREEERERMTAVIISVSWGLWILSILWLMFKPSWISTLTFGVLMLTSFASVYWGV